MKLFDLFVECSIASDEKYVFNSYQQTEFFRCNKDDLIKTLPSLLFPCDTSKIPDSPISHYFILTAGDGTRYYCCSIIFGTKEKELMSIALASSLQFYQTTKDVLTILYRKHPYEREIAKFLLKQIPMPPPGLTAVRFILDNNEFYVSRSPPNQLPMIDLPFWLPFALFSAEKLIIVVVSMMVEKRIVVSSTYHAAIAPFIESLLILMYPLECYSIYIPYIDSKLQTILESPFPYIIGVDPKIISLDNLEPDILVVDLDTSSVKYSKSYKPPIVYGKAYHKLKKSLNKVCKLFKEEERNLHLKATSLVNNDLSLKQKQFEFSVPNNAVNLNFVNGLFPEMIKPNKKNLFDRFNETRNGFLRYFVKVFMYDTHFLSDPSILNYNDFKTFYNGFVQTQIYQNFIEELNTFTKNNKVVNNLNDAKILFFIESIEAKKNRSILKRKKAQTPFLSNKAWEVSRVFNCPYIPTDFYKKQIPEPCNTVDLVNSILDFNTSYQFTEQLHTSNNSIISSLSSWSIPFQKLIPNQENYLSKFTDNRSALIIQKEYKRYISVLKFKTMKKAAIIINSFARMAIQKCFYENKMKPSAIILHITVRMFLQKKKYQLMKKSAITIESTIRMYLQKKKYLEMKKSAAIIESTIRMYLQKKKYLEMKKSAITIESTIRMSLQKKKYQLMKKSATNIESTIRMFIQRKEFIQMKVSIVKINALLKTKQQRKQYLEMKNSAVLIESTIRMFIQKKKYNNLLKANEQKSIINQVPDNESLPIKEEIKEEHKEVIKRRKHRKHHHHHHKTPQKEIKPSQPIQIFAKIWEIKNGILKDIRFNEPLPNLKYCLLIKRILYQKMLEKIKSPDHFSILDTADLVQKVTTDINSYHYIQEYQITSTDIPIKKIDSKLKSDKKKLYKTISRLQKKVIKTKNFDKIFEIYNINVKGKKRKYQLVDKVFDSLCFNPENYTFEQISISSKIILIYNKKVSELSLNHYVYKNK